MNVVQNNSATIDPALRAFVSALNDSPWSSPTARAEEMRRLAVAQLGSLGKIDSIKFAQKLAEQTIRRLLPPLLRQIGLNDAANRCEKEGTAAAADAACSAARSAARYDAAKSAALAANAAANAADAAANAADAAHAHSAALAASHAAYAAANAACSAHYAAKATRDDAARDGVLTFMCDICIDVLREMRAPGIALMDQVC